MLHDSPRARCWLEVNTAAILNNLRVTREHMLPDTQLIAVLKADAYGLGIMPVGKLLWANGVRRFSVACLEEAFQLREALPDAWILCMGETLDGNLKGAVSAGIRLTVGAYDSARRISAAACEDGQTAYIHCKVDTGLHRIGLLPGSAAETILRCAELPGISVEGVYTHLALHDRPHDIIQHEALESVLGALKSAGFTPQITHALDSIGLVRYPEWQYQAVRVGAMLYGNAPRGFDGADQVMPTVRFMARVARVTRVSAGELIGYDDDHPLERDTTVATLSVGYADGYPRSLSNCGEVEIRGKRAKNLGLICMDQMMVDVSDIPGVVPGDEAVLLGGGIDLRKYAEIGHLNRNECLAVIGKRVPRIYI